MPSRGAGRRAFAGLDVIDADDLIQDPIQDQSPLVRIVNDLWWGGISRPPPVQIPLSWLRGPVRVRQDPPRKVAEVTQSGSAAPSRVNVAARGERQWPFTATVDSVVASDPANLARWVTAYYSVPLPRASAFNLVLNARSQTEIWRILGVTLGTHISVTGTTNWPDGATELIVEGISHRIVGDARVVTWNTSPLVGTAAGTAGPYFRLGVTTLGSATDKMPF